MTPSTVPELLHAANAAVQGEVPVYLLGRGSNVLVDDGGLPGLTVSLRRLGAETLRVEPSSGHILAGAGVPMPRIAREAGQAGFAGFSFMAGIPGTLGGGLVMNAGTKTVEARCLQHVVRDVEVLTRGLDVISVEASDLALSERDSAVSRQNWVVLSARLVASGAEDARTLLDDMRRAASNRSRRQPRDKPTAGSVFKPGPGDTPAGWYLDRVGMRGRRCGDAMVAPRHANWICNLGAAQARDIRSLMNEGVRRVRDAFGVTLESEVVDLRDNEWQVLGQ